MIGSFSFPNLKKKTPKSVTKTAEVKITNEISLKKKRKFGKERIAQETFQKVEE